LLTRLVGAPQGRRLRRVALLPGPLALRQHALWVLRFCWCRARAALRTGLRPEGADLKRI